MRIAYVGLDPPDKLEGGDVTITAFDLPKSLTAFISNPILKDYSHIVINLLETKYSAPHILSAMQQLRQFSSAEITLVKEQCDATAELFACMQNFNIRNLVSACESTDIWEEIKACIAGKKTLQHIAQARIAGAVAAGARTASTRLDIRSGTNINIALIGALHRIGTTTQAIGIYHFLKGIGFAPVVVDKSGFIDLCRSYDETEIDDNGMLRIHGVRYDTNEHLNDKLVNASIFDLGTDAPGNMIDLLSADFIVIVCGSKINEIVTLLPLLGELTAIEENRIINIVSFCPEADIHAMSENLSGATFIAPYHPDIWGNNSDFYADIFYKKIKKLCNDMQED